MLQIQDLSKYIIIHLTVNSVKYDYIELKFLILIEGSLQIIFTDGIVLVTV